LLDDVLSDLETGVIPGEVAFKLYDTFGFPLDLTRDIARERELSVDEQGFETAMQAQRERARAAGQFSARDGVSAEAVADLPATEFLGYQTSECDSARVVAILVDGEKRESLSEGQSALVILDRTPFYAESGGQVGDTGTLETDGVRFRVDDTRKLAGAYHAHDGTLESGSMKVGGKVCAAIDEQRRADIVRHHSATHLLHAALREILGEHVQQKGSLVAADRLRFDFSHFEPVTTEQLREIETRVNEQIQANVAASAEEMDYDQAMDAGALAFFGDKYGDRVRVLQFGDYSTELCGGTHVDRVGDIGAFKIVHETGISAGVRRIEAVAGRRAVAWMQDTDRTLRSVAERLKSSPEQVGTRVEQLLDRSRELEKELERIKHKLASARGSDLSASARDIGGIKILAERLAGVDPNSLRDTVDQLKNKLGSAIVVLGTEAGDGVRLVAGVTGDLTDRFKAGELVNFVAGQVGGKGGGRPDFAQAGGSDAENLGAALESVFEWVERKK
ncbi:MAG TPA: alanine--tRNA ligase, partial [Wenzhouxiangellaceae bacterium]|nr:alanine--tRNA ligase [Wenzhouxiangellaceae bacterium]